MEYNSLCVCACVCMCVCAQSVPQSCPTPLQPMDCRLPGSCVHGIFQARILECVTTSYSKRSSQPRNRTLISCVSCIAGRFFTIAPPIPCAIGNPTQVNLLGNPNKYNLVGFLLQNYLLMKGRICSYFHC